MRNGEKRNGEENLQNEGAKEDFFLPALVMCSKQTLMAFFFYAPLILPYSEAPSLNISLKCPPLQVKA